MFRATSQFVFHAPLSGVAYQELVGENSPRITPILEIQQTRAVRDPLWYIRQQVPREG